MSLSPRLARTFYNLADALFPPQDEEPGAGDVDLVPELVRWLAAVPPVRRARLRRGLLLLEWAPLLTLRRGGFSWLPRPERRRWLERLERAPLGALRATGRDLRDAACAAWLRHGGVIGTGSNRPA
jgi:hypothetical protein